MYHWLLALFLLSYFIRCYWLCKNAGYLAKKTFVLSVPSKDHHLGSCSKNQQMNNHPHLDHNL